VISVFEYLPWSHPVSALRLCKCQLFADSSIAVLGTSSLKSKVLTSFRWLTRIVAALKKLYWCS